jgi:hypothetical protein
VKYTFESRRNQFERTVELVLAWEVSGDPITDDYLPEEIDAPELWRMWRQQNPGSHAEISWYITSLGDNKVFEGAPFQDDISYRKPGDPDFLTYFTMPIDEDGEPVTWTRLPVLDKLWRPGQPDKGGFIQEASGWKPSPLQLRMDVDRIASAARLP